MKLSVSNIAWDDSCHQEAVSMLTEYGAEGVEIAPTRVWPAWKGMSPHSALSVMDQFATQGLKISSFQSLLFGLPQLNVFGSESRRQELTAHLERVFEIAGTIGALPMVFGSPKNRDRTGLSDAIAMDRAIEFFSSAAEKAQRHSVILCVEANPEQYGSNFVTSWREAKFLVEAVDNPSFGLHLDTGCIHMSGDDPAEAVYNCRDLLRHFHISEPFLNGFAAPEVSHSAAANALRDIGYQGWTTIEMRCGTTPLPDLERALRFTRRVYYGTEA